MEYSSFYGGRRGASFIIVKNFATVKAMADQFKRGANYTEVKFDEYVLIDTTNKNNPDNGKIFKRGYGYNSGKTIQWNNPSTGRVQNIDAGGAQYIGRIGGTTGMTPQLVLTTYTDANTRQSGQNWEERRNQGSYTLANQNLIPGKDGTIYNDSIDWCSVSMRDTDAQDAIAYIGFKVPYLVNQFISESVDAYNDQGIYEDMSSVERVDDGTHPFYNKIKVKIPKGVKGDSLRNLRSIVPNSSMNIYTPGTQTLYPNYNADIASGRSIIVYDSYSFDDNLNPTPVTYYLGTINSITGMNLDQHGGLTIDYDGAPSVSFPNTIKWIDEILFDTRSDGSSELGYLTVKFNTLDQQGNQEYVEGSFDYVNNIEFFNNGSVKVDTVQRNDQLYTNLIKWISQLSLSNGGLDQGKFSVQFNDGDSYETYLHWVKGIYVDSHGVLRIQYAGPNGGTTIPMQDEDHNNIILKTVDDFRIDSTQGSQTEGKMEVKYNTSQNYSLLGNLKWVNDIDVSNTGQITLKYSGGGTDQILSTQLKYVTDISIANNGIVTAYYNDDTSAILSQSTKLKWIDDISLSNGTLHIDYNTFTGNVQDSQDFLLNYPTDFTLNNSGQFSVNYANGTSVYKNTIKSLTNLTINNTTSKLQATYNTGSSQDIGVALNYIQQMAINTDNNHLLVFYSDPNQRSNITYNGISGWTDLGYLFDGININNAITNLANRDILITNNEQINISSWYGSGIIRNDNALLCSLPLNKIMSLSSPTGSISSGTLYVYYRDRQAASVSLSSLNPTVVFTNSGFNLIISNISYNLIPTQDEEEYPIVVNPTPYSTVGIGITNLTLNITQQI